MFICRRLCSNYKEIVFTEVSPRSTSESIKMENQATLMVNCMLMAFQRFQLNTSAISNNNAFNNSINLASSSNFTFDNQTTAGDSSDTNLHDFQLSDHIIQQ